MHSLSHNSLSKRILALIGATGTTALLGLPVLAQANPNSTTNQAPYSLSQSGQTAVQCPPTVGGVGGPVGSESNNQTGAMSSTAGNAATSDSKQTSYDTASQGVNPNSSTAGSTDSSSTGSMTSGSTSQDNSSASGSNQTAQFSGDNPRPAVANRDNGPAGTSGREVTTSLEANTSSGTSGTSSNTSGSQMSGSQTSGTSGSYTGSNQTFSGMKTDGQFSGRNRNAAIAYRSNGPAGTSGLEAKANLDAFISNDSRGNSDQSAMQSSSNVTTSSSQSYQSAAPIPAECIPGASNQSAPTR